MQAIIDPPIDINSAEAISTPWHTRPERFENGVIERIQSRAEPTRSRVVPLDNGSDKIGRHGAAAVARRNQRDPSLGLKLVKRTRENSVTTQPPLDRQFALEPRLKSLECDGIGRHLQVLHRDFFSEPDRPVEDNLTCLEFDLHRMQFDQHATTGPQRRGSPVPTLRHPGVDPPYVIEICPSIGREARAEGPRRTLTLRTHRNVSLEQRTRCESESQLREVDARTLAVSQAPERLTHPERLGEDRDLRRERREPRRKLFRRVQRQDCFFDVEVERVEIQDSEGLAIGSRDNERVRRIRSGSYDPHLPIPDTDAPQGEGGGSRCPGSPRLSCDQELRDVRRLVGRIARNLEVEAPDDGRPDRGATEDGSRERVPKLDRVGCRKRSSVGGLQLKTHQCRAGQECPTSDTVDRQFPGHRTLDS